MNPVAQSRQWDLGSVRDPEALCRVLRRRQTASLFLDGRGEFVDSWTTGPLVAVTPSPEAKIARTLERDGPRRALRELDTLIRRRRAEGGTAWTGVAVLLGYDLLSHELGVTAEIPGPGSVVVVLVDRSVSFSGDGSSVLTVRGSSGKQLRDRLSQWLETRFDEPPRPARLSGKPFTSLPREDYLGAVASIREHIRRGEIYQANLCQRFVAPYAGDELELQIRLCHGNPAPHSAFLEVPGFSLASASPETFLRVRSSGRVETLPIKGTRPRAASPDDDRAAARALLHSEKDRAELLMIVDLERNDLGRVCRTGSIRVRELAALRSFPAVHHLVAHIEGQLREGVGVGELLRATFPGGSITGAPKIRAMQVLDRLEPARRGFFTGSLMWFGDDGSMDSSILIRSLEFVHGHVHIGAGGGVVYDSDPEEEWHESNLKAAALAAGLGFHPEDAS